MPAPNLHTASAITATSFVASWDAFDTARNYFLDVSADNFQTFVVGYENLEVGNVTQYEVTGLVEGLKYQFRIRSEFLTVSGTATENGTLTLLTDSTKSMVINEHVGKQIEVVDVNGTNLFTITANTETTITVADYGFEPHNYAVAVDNSGTYTVDELAGGIIWIWSGTGSSRVETIYGNTATKIFCTNWDVIPSGGASLYRIRTAESSETATGGTTTTIENSAATYTVDAFIGMEVLIYSGTAEVQRATIISNTATEITVDGFSTAPVSGNVYIIMQGEGTVDLAANPTKYAIVDISGYSFTEEVITGFSVSGITIEVGNLAADVFSVKGISIEVSTDYNFQCIVRDNEENTLSGANCLIIREGWEKKGVWLPSTEAAPVLGDYSEGDYFLIGEDAVTNISGEDEEINTVDILVKLNNVWEIKRRRNVDTVVGGLANMYIDYEVLNKLVIYKEGYEIERQKVQFIYGKHQYDAMLYPIKSVINTTKGHAVSARPYERQNLDFL